MKLVLFNRINNNFLFAAGDSNPPVRETINGFFICPNCGKLYKHKTSVYTHMKNDCGKIPKFFCEPCKFYCKYDHVFRRHCLSMAHSKKVSLQNKVFKLRLPRYP